MNVNVYRKEKESISQNFFENYEEGLYATIHNIDTIKDIETDYDLLSNGNLIKRYRKDEFYLII